MVTKTIKQIKNLKAYRNSPEVKGYETSIWTAKIINGTWNWGWYYLSDFIKNNEEYYNSINDRFEYDIPEIY